MKLKPLIPTQREKKRYVLFRVLSQKTHMQSHIEQAIIRSFVEWTGVKGLSESGFKFMGSLFNPKLQTGVIKVTPGSLNDLKSAFALTQSIEGAPAIVASVRTSGALNKVKTNEV